MGGYHERREDLIHSVQLLYNHCGRGTTAIADGSHTIFTGLQLVEQGDQDSGARATQSMAQRDGSAQHVNLGILQSKNLSRTWVSIDTENPSVLHLVSPSHSP